MPMTTHRRELLRFATFLLCLLVLEGVLYLIPGTEAALPWLRSEPVPLLRLIPTPVAAAPTPRPVIEVVCLELPVTPERPTSQRWQAAIPRAVQASELAQRELAVATPLEIPDHALDAFFLSLAESERGGHQRLSRVLHWGDSTIAGDGITGTVRRRLAKRFGNGGPGFLAAYTDPVWSLLPGIERSSEGSWQSLTIISEGPDERRCGLAGCAATAEEAAQVTLAGYRVQRSRQVLDLVDVFYQLQPDGGTLVVALDEEEVLRQPTVAETIEDRFLRLDLAGRAPRSLRLQALGDGPVTLYGAALEAAGPGVTWETFGVAGASVWNLLRQEEQHFTGQIARRHPDLLVLQTGGNELHHPGLAMGEGKRYASAMRMLLRLMREAAPDASCLVIAPLDQATRTRGQVVSDPLLERVITIQRKTATKLGCAFWDARNVMGGDGGFQRWLEHSPRYAWTDLKHLTNRGLEEVGASLADALVAAYDRWSEVNPDVGRLPPPASSPPPTPTPSPTAAPAAAPGDQQEPAPTGTAAQAEDPEDAVCELSAPDPP